jgi:glycosyltransferase involved in cell wall biosynthesis
VARTGATVDVVQACHHEARLSLHNVDFHFVRGAAPFTKLSLAWRLIDCVRLLRPDVVQVAGLGSPLQTHQLSRRLPSTPVLVQDHAGVPPSRVRKSVHRWGLSQVDAALFTAREQAEPYFSAGVLRPDLPIFEALEGSSSFTPGNQAEARGRTGLTGDPCLLWLGRLDANKDPLSVLDSVRLAAKELPGVQLFCCFTDGELEPKVCATIEADDRLKRIVHLLGKRPHAEIETLCRAADFLVQGSWREGSGYALTEALACGLPAVVTDIPSFEK